MKLHIIACSILTALTGTMEWVIIGYAKLDNLDFSHPDVIMALSLMPLFWIAVIISSTIRIRRDSDFWSFKEVNK